MQIALRSNPFENMPANKREMSRYAVDKVLGTAARWTQGPHTWLVFSDPSITWEDVRRVIAVVQGAGQFPNTAPPKVKRSKDTTITNRHVAEKTVRDWSRGRLPPRPAEGVDPAEHYERPWLKFSTEGMTPPDPEAVTP